MKVRDWGALLAFFTLVFIFACTAALHIWPVAAVALGALLWIVCELLRRPC